MINLEVNDLAGFIARGVYPPPVCLKSAQVDCFVRDTFSLLRKSVYRIDFTIVTGVRTLDRYSAGVSAME